MKLTALQKHYQQTFNFYRTRYHRTHGATIYRPRRLGRVRKGGKFFKKICNELNIKCHGLYGSNSNGKVNVNENLRRGTRIDTVAGNIYTSESRMYFPKGKSEDSRYVLCYDSCESPLSIEDIMVLDYKFEYQDDSVTSEELTDIVQKHLKGTLTEAELFVALLYHEEVMQLLAGAEMLYKLFGHVHKEQVSLIDIYVSVLKSEQSK